MKKSKKAKLLTKNNIIFISLIISMSIVGVGYAEWNDLTTIDLSIKTGYIDKEIVANGKGSITTNYDGKTLYVKGEIYPEYEGSLTINIIDKGTVPSIIRNISPLDNKIYNISRNMDSFDILINPNFNSNEKETVQSKNLNSESIDYISELNNKICNINNEMNAYCNNIGNYNFYYTIDYELKDGVWQESIYIIGNIDVVPNPEILAKMKNQLVELQIQVEEQKSLEEQKTLLEKIKIEELEKLESIEFNQNLQEIDNISNETNVNRLINNITEQINESDLDHKIMNDVTIEIENTEEDSNHNLEEIGYELNKDKEIETENNENEMILDNENVESSSKNKEIGNNTSQTDNGLGNISNDKFNQVKQSKEENNTSQESNN